MRRVLARTKSRFPSEDASICIAFNAIEAYCSPRSNWLIEPKYNLGVNSVQANPNKTKQKTWIFLVLFIRIGTSQWVTGEKIKKMDSRLKLCAKRLKRTVVPPELPQDARSIQQQRSVAQNSDLCKLKSTPLHVASDFPDPGKARRAQQARAEARARMAPMAPMSKTLAPKSNTCEDRSAIAFPPAVRRDLRDGNFL